MESKKEKIVFLSSKDVKSLGEIDADYIVIFDKGAEVGISELTSLAEEMSKNDGVTAVCPKGSFLTKFNSLLYGVAAGKKIPVAAGAVGFSREVAAAISGARKNDTVSLLMEAAALGIKTHSISAGEGCAFNPARLIPRWWSLFLSSHILKYIFSSVVAFAVNYVLILVFTELLMGLWPALAMEIAAIPAWILASATNFIINRNFVFRSKAKLLVALGEYYGLAGIVFLLKTYVLLELLTRLLHIPLELAVPITEVLFFMANYFIQKKLIFKKKQK
ncbi:MAG: GtrA family protein [Ruminococcaceae bacterium]|nr:GtrA family protein [Oscillospiraceae bacterium]